MKLVGKVFLPFSFVHNILCFRKAMLWISKSYALWLLKRSFKLPYGRCYKYYLHLHFTFEILYLSMISGEGLVIHPLN